MALVVHVSSDRCPGFGRQQLDATSRSKSFSRKCKPRIGSNHLRIEAQQKPMNAIISGAPASGKGTQCELITAKYGLVHISAGDLLRAEVAAASEYGRKAKVYMDQGKLVPDDIVVTMVKDRLGQSDVKVSGWLLDGYPRSLEQAKALEALDIRPQLFILLEVPEDILVDRVVGRRLDPVTGKIYHMKYSPPETPEIAARLTQRTDDTEEKVKTRLRQYRANLDSVLSVYQDVVKTVDGNRPKAEVFSEISGLLDSLPVIEVNASALEPRTNVMRAKLSFQDSWRGVPTRLNSIPHSREIRQYFYKDICEAAKNAVEDGRHKLKVEVLIPELNPEMDVYRGGTLLELLRELAFTFADDGKRVKVCVQGSMGEGIFSGVPLQLSGARRMLELMDWGDYDAKGTFINFGAVGAKEVTETDDMFILMAPQNSVGSCIIDVSFFSFHCCLFTFPVLLVQDLQSMVRSAGNRPVILVNPRLNDVPGAGGKMQVIGRQERMEFAESFYDCYSFKLLYVSGTQYPIMGALRRKYPGDYQVFRRVDHESGKERYMEIAKFQNKPTPSQLQDAFSGRKSNGDETKKGGLWSFLSMFNQ